MSATTTIGTDSLIERNPTRWAGRPVIAGKNVTVRKIGWFWEQGLSAEEIWAEWDGFLERAEVYAALAYYFVNRDWFIEDAQVLEREHREAMAKERARLEASGMPVVGPLSKTWQ